MNRYDYTQQDELPTRRPQRDIYQDDLPLRQPAAQQTSLPTGGRDREYTLSTGIVLGIFFGLALICSVFFGFGYTLGRKSLQPTTTAEGTAAEGADPTTFSKFKPAAGSASGTSTATLATPVAQPAAASLSTASTSPASYPAATTTSRSTSAPQPATSAPQNTPPATVTAATKAPETAAPVVHESPAVAAPATGGTTMVQIAAVSHPEDAEVLTAALRRRGYTVLSRNDTGDRLIHVQVGPFPTRKDAEAMRQKLINDGYNAILK